LEQKIAANLTGDSGKVREVAACARPTGTQWPLFWGGLTVAVAGVLVYFLVAYRGIGKENSTMDEHGFNPAAKNTLVAL
jgi:hypothetical protein